jgi:archaemetzincin
MKIGILSIGKVDSQIIERIRESLNTIFPKTTLAPMTKPLPTPEEAYDEKRQQYNTDIMLDRIRNHTEKEKNLDKILAIADCDIFAPRLSFVFGKAEYPGKIALISLHRLRQEFYGKNPNTELFLERSVKESVHELGHTLGLRHCPNPFCVMYFSNSIFETDRKQSLFCSKCYTRIEDSLNNQA